MPHCVLNIKVLLQESFFKVKASMFYYVKIVNIQLTVNFTHIPNLMTISLTFYCTLFYFILLKIINPESNLFKLQTNQN